MLKTRRDAVTTLSLLMQLGGLALIGCGTQPSPNATHMLGLGADHSLHTRRKIADELGQTHLHYDHLYRGVRVWGGDIIVHGDAAEPTITGDLMRDISIDTVPAIEEHDALAVVNRDLQPKGPYVRAPTAELVIYPQIREEASRTRVRGPSGELNAVDVERHVTGYILAYYVHTELENGATETAHTDYLIDARSRHIIEKWDALETAADNGAGNSQYSGAVTIGTNTTTGGWELRDVARGMSFATYDLNHLTSGTGSIYTDADNTWGDGANYISGGSTSSANGQTAAIDAHYGVAKTFDYYKYVHGRNGIDNNGTPTYNRVHYSFSFDNAFWSDQCFCMTYGDGSSFNVLTALDVAGHEMSHGVTSRTAGLIYSAEPGGLNESMSDIGATMTEFYARGGNGSIIGNTGGTWTIGEQLSTLPLRYLYKPSLDGVSPDAWYSGIGGLNVHYSSGPMNRAFYFLSQGASTDSTSNYYSPYLPGGMIGIGNDHAARIQYKALTTYMTSNTPYAGARQAFLNAAQSLYGVQSADYTAVENAFAAINVGAPHITVLTNDVAVGNQSGYLASRAFYKIAIPSGQPSLTVRTAGGTGNVTLYVKQGSWPTPSSYDCASEASSGNEETCTVSNPAAGDWYVMIQAVAPYSGVAIIASYTVVLTNGVALDNRAGLTGEEAFYKIAVPSGQTTLTVRTSGGTGDVSLYVKLGSPPATNAYDCVSTAGLTDESCTIQSPAAGDWYVMIRSSSSYSGVSIVATHLLVLANGVAVYNQAGLNGLQAFYKITVPSGRASLAVRTSGGQGDANLYVKFGSLPATSSYDCSSTGSTSDEVCIISSPLAGDWYIALTASSSYSGVMLVADYATVLANGVALINQSAPTGAQTYYKITVPPGQASLVVQTSPTSVWGNEDLYVNFGSVPTTSSYNCRSTNGTNVESCVISSPAGGDWYIMLNSLSSYASVTIVAYYITAVLDEGVVLDNQSGSTGSQFFYKITVPAGQTSLRVQTSRGTGDANLYVRFGSPPTSSAYDCISASNTNDETCIVSNPAGGDWYVMLRAYSSYSQLSVDASYWIVLTSGVALDNQAGPTGSQAFYKITVPSGRSSLTVQTSGGTGNANLYVRFGSQAGTASFDCSSTGSTNDETCTIADPTPGDWYITLHAASPYSALRILAYDVTTLGNGVALPSQSSNGVTGHQAFYKFTLPPGAVSSLQVDTASGTGNADLYVKLGSPPTRSSYDCRAASYGNTETCVIPNAQPGDWYIMLYASSPYAGLTIVARYIVSLANGVAVDKQSGDLGSQTVYKIHLPAGQAFLTVQTVVGTGNPDLYVKYGTLPTTTSNDCLREGATDGDTCTFSNPAEGDWYIMVNAVSSYSDLSIVATHGAALEDEYPLVNQSATAGNQAIYKIVVPWDETILRVQTMFGTGNADLYVKFGSSPTTSTYDCKSTGSTSDEICTIPNAAMGDWYVMLNAVSSYSDLWLEADYSAITVLSDGTSLGSQSGPSGSQAFYKIALPSNPSGLTTLRVETSGGTGDVDMYVKSGAWPTTSAFDCRSNLDGNSEVCTFNNPTPGDWYIMLNANAAYSGISIVADYQNTDYRYLANGVPITGIAGNYNSQQYWRLAVPYGRTQVAFTLSGGTGDADMYVRLGSPPTITTYTCRPRRSGNEETCTISLPHPGDWYVMLRGYANYSGVSLKGQYF